MGMRRQLYQHLPLIAALSVAAGLACRAAGLPAPPTATPEIIADCFWSAEAFTWLDTDGSGTYDDGEPPLAGVEVTFGLTFYGSTTTDADGRAHLSGMHPGGCDDPFDNAVIASVPEGYTATTELVVAYAEAQDQYAFGFQPAP